MDDRQAFGRRLRRLRKARDLTQEALAQQADCAVDMIKKIEAGVRRPSRQRAEVLADLLALAGSERVAFLQAARAELSPDRLTAPTQRFNLAPPILPQGTVTFLFTDIEGSTRLWEQHPQAMPEALAGHDAILRAAIEADAGVVFRTVGTGCVRPSGMLWRRSRRRWRRSGRCTRHGGGRLAQYGYAWRCTRAWSRWAGTTTSACP